MTLDDLPSHFAYLADSPGADALLAAICAQATGVEVRRDVLVVHFDDDRDLIAEPPGDPTAYARWPRAFQVAIAHHACLAFPDDDGWCLMLGDHGNYEGPLRSPIRDFSDWYVYDPTQPAADGEPGLAFDSHEGGGVQKARGYGLGTTFLLRIAEALELDVELPAPTPTSMPAPATAITPVAFDDGAARELDEAFVLRRLTGHRSKIGRLVFAPDGRLASGADAVDKMGEIRIWAATAATCQHVLRKQDCFDVRDLAFSPDGRWLVTAHHGDGHLQVWDSHTGEAIARARDRLDPLYAVGFSADGAQALGFRFGRTPARFSTTTWTVIEEGSDEGGGAAPRFSSRGALAIGIDDNALCLVEAGVARVLGTHDDMISDEGAIAFSHDGRRVVSSDNSGGIKVWDVSSGSLVAAFTESERIAGCALSPDGVWLATCTDDCVRLWNVTTRAHVATRQRDVRDQGHMDTSSGAGPTAVAFAVDDASFAVGTYGGAIVQVRVPT